MKRGITLIELLVAIAASTIILAAVYSFYVYFIDQASQQRVKAEFQRKVRLALKLLEDDVRHAGFGLRKRSFCNGKGICLFYIDNNCNVTETFCKKGTDRFFVADGWQIIKDFTDNREADGNITDIDYETMSENKFFSRVIDYVEGSKNIKVDKLDIDNRFGNDIKDNKAIIICGRQNGTGKVGQEGKRLASITGTTLKFLKKEGALSYPNKCMYNCTKSCEGIVLPANVWYVRINGGTYWLYRNEEKVIPDVEDFQVFVGYDLNGDGVVEDSELKKTDSLPGDAVPENLRFFLFKIKAAYYWKNEKYQLNSAIRVETFH
jgi:prepilin-type N-terminal cleavage/methylation domain-containing protein